jgi:hypothetical protein
MPIIAGLIGALVAAISVPLYPYLFDPAQPSVDEILFGAPSSGANYVANTLKLPNLLSKGCIGTDGTGLVQEGSCTGGGGGGSFPFTATTNYGQVVYATSTPTLWFQSGVFASSTSHFVYASSTALTAVSGFFTNLFIGADTIAEYVADTAGAMFTGNTESGITVTYQDADNTTDFTVAAGVANLTSSDFGDWTCNGSACTLDDDVVGTAEMANADHGDFTYSGGVATLDADVVSTAEIADADFGDWTCSGGVCSLDADVVAAAELADADWGDISISGGVASIDANTVALTTDTTGDYTAGISSSGSITVGNGSGEGAAATVNLNMGNANTWTALQTFANASTTLLSAGYASSTLYYGAGLANCNTGNMLTWTDGRFGCEDDSTGGGGGSFPFSATTNFGQVVYATSTPTLWFQSGMFASSTSWFTNTITTNATTTNATSTTLNVSGQVDFDTLTSALLLTGAGGVLAEYTGTSCVGNVLQSLSALGVATCTDVNSAIIDQTDSYSWTGTHNFGGGVLEIPNGSSPTVDAIGEIALDTTANELLLATSTSATAPGVLKMWQPIRFSYASSTQGSGTTTRSLGVAPAAGYLDEIQCDFSNFMRVMIYDGTNRLNDLVASSTIGTVKFTANNSFTSGEAMRVDIGTTTAIAANVYGGCTAKFYYTRN